MSTFKTRAAAVSVAVALGLGSVALAAAPAEAAGPGTVTKAEAKRVNKQLHKQRCLTRKETFRIIHGTGSTDDKRERTIRWDGKGSVISFTVKFKKKCAYKTILWEDA